jgi:aryl-alcohol dehydrogenase-like predicted oxidoreductase
MQFRNLGRSGLVVSAIAHGTWVTHGFDEATSIAVARAALDHGITTFDSADVYNDGQAEIALGKALAGERREGLVISTKAYWPSGPGANDRGLSRKHLVAAIDGSLRRLGLDYVDVFHAHRFDTVTPLEETMSVFADIIRSGKALYLGVSEWTGAQIRAAHVLARQLRLPLISSEPQYSMLWRVIEAEVVPACEEAGIGQIVWSPLAQGVLSGKYSPTEARPAGTRGADDRASAGFMRTFLTPEVLAAVQGLKPLADQAGLTLPQLAIAWVLRNPNVSAAIVGASRPEQVAANVSAADTTLDDDLMKAIDEVIGEHAERDPARTVAPLRTPRPTSR